MRREGGRGEAEQPVFLTHTALSLSDWVRRNYSQSHEESAMNEYPIEDFSRVNKNGRMSDEHERRRAP